ncbi:putative quinol monooxygenase (plasmid) [Enterococcus sp. 22-H-5-01]|uniref:putative quinol monooxygenase n=1 Tax=Enterococcus sp. 22-H-5-01 TaxID=3418555 RepID=UPI003D08C7DE
MKTINATVYVQPGKENTFLELAADLTANTLQEAGNLRFDLYKGTTLNTFVFIEVYQDQEAIIAHRDSEHFQKFLTKYKKIQNGPMDVMIFESLGSEE